MNRKTGGPSLSPEASHHYVTSQAGRALNPRGHMSPGACGGALDRGPHAPHSGSNRHGAALYHVGSEGAQTPEAVFVFAMPQGGGRDMDEQAGGRVR